MWRLRQSAHADKDMLLLETIRPYVADELLEKNPHDAMDVLEGIGYVVDVESPESEEVKELKDLVADTNLEKEIRKADMKVETLRKIMSVVQDRCDEDIVTLSRHRTA